MNETFLHGVWRTVVTLLGLFLALASLYVLLHAVGVAPALRYGTVVVTEQRAEPVSQPPRTPEPPLWDSPFVTETPASTEEQATTETVEPASGGPILFRLDLQQQPLTLGLLWMLGGVLGIVVGGLLVALGLARVEGAGRTVVLRGLDGTVMNGSGRVTVSMRSLHALVTNVAERIDGVREAQARLRLKRAGWHVDCTVAHAPETPLPAIAGQLKQQLQEALEHHTGLPVARINIAGRLGLVEAQRRVH